MEYLKKGDTIAIIAPSGPIKDFETLKKCINFFEVAGYKIKTGKHLKAQNNYLAGTDKERLFDLHSAFLDKETKLILTARGGYGATRLLPFIDYKIIKANPKPIIGYSDITALLNTLPCPCFLGPMGVSDFGQNPDEVTITSFFETLSNKASRYYKTSDFATINKGISKGQLIGGNLSVLCSLLGTPYQPDFKGKILLLEDINEPLYKLDRMLTQLKQTGALDCITGIIFADFDCKKDKEFISFLKSFLKNTPAFLGFDCSHQKRKYTLELKKEYTLDTIQGSLSLNN